MNIFDNLTIDDIETLYPIDEETTEPKKATKKKVNKEEKTMNRIIKKVTLEKNSNGIYDWKYEKIDANGVSIASSKADYNENVECSLEWKVNPHTKLPTYMIVPEKYLDMDAFMDKAKSATFNEGKTMYEAIIGKDGKVKIACFASQGGVKSGERYYCDEKFVKNHKAEGSMIDYSAEPLMEQYLKLRREISVINFKLAPMYLNSFEDESWNAKMAPLKDESARLMRKLDEVMAAMGKSLLYNKFSVANANQTTAFFWTPDKKIGSPMNVRIMNEINTKVICEGYVDTRNENSWDVQDDMEGEKPHMIINVDDGSAFVDRTYANEHGFCGEGIEDMVQARSGIGYKNGRKAKIALDFKGTIQIVDMPEGMKDGVYLSETCAKAIKRFSKEDIESCEYQFYFMEKNIHEDGTVDMGPQVLMYGLHQAKSAEIKRLINGQVEELTKLGDKDGYMDLVKKMTSVEYTTVDGSVRVTSILEHAAFSKMALSKMFLYSAAKQATAMYNKLRGCTITVDGASAKAQGDIEAILAVYKAQLEGKELTAEEAATIPANTVIVPVEWKKFGLVEGQEIFVWRNPYNSTIASVVKIHAFSELRNTLQFSLLDANTHNLASDNDGDTIYVSWNKDVVNIFKRANKFAKQCGAKVLAYRTGEEDPEDRGIPSNEYLEFAPENGAVGLVCEPLFGLTSLIPFGCKNPDEEIYCGEVEVPTDEGTCMKEVYTTPREIYSLLGHGFVGTTYTIDSAKKHYVNAYNETAQTKRIKEIVNGGTYYTKVYYHPNNVKCIDDKFYINGNEIELIGENGGLATLAKIAMDKVCPNLDVIVDYVDIINGYCKGENDYTQGFVYCPEDDSFDGIDPDIFMIETDFEEANEDLRDGGLYLNVDQLTTDNLVKINGKIKTGSAVRSWLINDMTERTSDMSDEEKWTAVSLNHRYNQRMTLGLLRNRLLHAASNAQDHSYYENKGKTRDNIDDRMIEVIKEWVRIYCDKKCTNVQAIDILYDEVASYLFSGEADERYGSDVQAFLSNTEFVTRLFAQEKIWLKKKIEANEIEFKTLTPFEKALHLGKIDHIGKTKNK